MVELLEIMKRDLELGGYSTKTQDDYLRHVRKFQAHFGRPLTEMCYEEIKCFLHHAITQRKLSCSYVNSAYSALKFLYETTLEREWKIKAVPRVKKEKFLPAILSRSEIQQILNVTRNIKHKAILTATYSAGLRVSEVARLTIDDIDSKNMQIIVKQGKGKKDRYTLLSQKNLELLRQYWRHYQPKHWLFPGKPDDKPISIRNVQQIFYDSLAKAGIKKDVSIHTLRHCFATHLLENGTDIAVIKHLMGHSSLQTTCLYLHLRSMDIMNVKSPFDLPTGPNT